MTYVSFRPLVAKPHVPVWLQLRYLLRMLFQAGASAGEVYG